LLILEHAEKVQWKQFSVCRRKLVRNCVLIFTVLIIPSVLWHKASDLRSCWLDSVGSFHKAYTSAMLLSSNSTGTSFPVTSSRTYWRCRQLPRNKLATGYEEVSYTPDNLDMLRWSESRQLPRNFLVTSWRHARLPRN